MARRGVSQGIELLIGVAIALLVVVVAVFLIAMGPRAWKETITCMPEDSSQFACVAVSKGCDSVTPGEWDRALTKFFGCGKGEICCVANDGGKTAAPGTDPEDEPAVWPPALTMDIYRLGTVTELKPGTQLNAEIRTRSQIPNGAAIPTFAGTPTVLSYEFDLEGCEGAKKLCWAPTLQFQVTDEAGQDVSRLVMGTILSADYSPLREPPASFGTITAYTPLPGDRFAEIPSELTYIRLDDEGNIADAYPESTAGRPRYRQLAFQFPESFIGQTVTVELDVSMYHVEDGKEPDENEVTAITRSHTLRFQVKPTVRYGPLTQKWERSKEIFAICESPIECQNMYFRVVASPNDCSKLPEYAGKSEDQHQFSIGGQPYVPQLTRDQRVYCIRNEEGVQESCHSSQPACIEALGVDASGEYSAAFAAAMRELSSRTDIPEELSVFWQQEDKVSRRSCLPDMPDREETRITGSDTLEGAPLGPGLLFRANQPDLTQDRWAFTLDMPYMQDQYLCVYGQSKTDPAKIYSAGEGQQIKIDRIPPTGQIKFNPLSLRLTLLCEDANGSQCRQEKGIGYISQIEDFLPALVSGRPQNAYLWCPQSNGAYRPEDRDEIIYNDGMVRVMCLQVKDEAGNVGYAMKTVFNSYTVLGALIDEYLEDAE